MTSFKYKQRGKVGLFDGEVQKEKLSKLENPLDFQGVSWLVERQPIPRCPYDLAISEQFDTER